LSGQPRSGDIVALEPGEVWELRRNVLDRLMRLPAQRARIDRMYQDRALELLPGSTGLFKHSQKSLSFANPFPPCPAPPFSEVYGHCAHAL